MLREWTREALRDTFGVAYAWLTEPFTTLGKVPVSAATILKLLIFVVLVFWVARMVRRLLVRRIFPRFNVEAGIAYALANLTAYVVMTVGLVIGLQTAGIDLSTLTVLAGALGVGIGFGLQNIAANFVSGLILLLERPIQVGDRIQLEELDGRVVRIRARATEIVTNDNISVIVPNSEFTSQRVINWSHGDPKIRIHVPVGVAYGSDVHQVRDVLTEAARSVEAILHDPPPKVWFAGFGDSSLNFELLVWTRELLQRRGECISRVNFAIQDALARNGIQIPFPQRDLHLKSAVPLPVADRGAESDPADAPGRET